MLLIGYQQILSLIFVICHWKKGFVKRVPGVIYNLLLPLGVLPSLTLWGKQLISASRSNPRRLIVLQPSAECHRSGMKFIRQQSEIRIRYSPWFRECCKSEDFNYWKIMLYSTVIFRDISYETQVAWLFIKSLI